VGHLVGRRKLAQEMLGEIENWNLGVKWRNWRM
jgi:hypothetical protein